MTIASCYCVIHLYVFPLLGSWYFRQCRKRSASAASIEYDDHVDGSCKGRRMHLLPNFYGHEIWNL
jgi:hypothetical protein